MSTNSVPMIVEALSEIVPGGVSIAVADPSRYIFYKPSPSIDLKIKPGDAVREGTVSYKALTIKEKVSEHVHSDVLGIPYYGMSIPIMNQDEAPMCVTAIFPHVYRPEWQNIPNPQLLIGKAGDRWFPLAYQEIIYIQSHQGKTLLQTVNAQYINKFSLFELEYLLPADQFIRCHRSFFVHVQAIAEIHPDFHSTFTLVMKDEQRSRIPVSQTYASSFRKYLGF